MSASPKRLCLYGAGGHGRVVATQAQRMLGREVCFADDRLAAGTMVLGVRVLWTALADVDDAEVIVTIGNNAIRAVRQVEAETLGLAVATFVAEPDRCYAVAVGSGSMILQGATVNAGTSLARGVIVNTNAVVEHDVVAGEFCHFAPGSIVAGGVQVGARAFVGAGAIIIPGLSIAADSVIGAGAVVTTSIEIPGTYVGVPARLTRKDARP